MERVKEEKNLLKAILTFWYITALSRDFFLFLAVDDSLCSVNVPSVWTTASPDLVIPS